MIEYEEEFINIFLKRTLFTNLKKNAIPISFDL